MGDMADVYDRDDRDYDYTVVCDRCGEEDLHWEVRLKIPKLCNEDGDIHRCEPDAEGFEAL